MYKVTRSEIRMRVSWFFPKILDLKTKLAGFADHNESSSLFLASTSGHFATTDGSSSELRAELEAKEAVARDLSEKLSELERANHDLRDELTAAATADG